MSDQSDQEKTFPVVMVVSDQGDFGLDYCGNCHEILNNHPNRCPRCGVKLEGSELYRSCGGQDF